MNASQHHEKEAKIENDKINNLTNSPKYVFKLETDAKVGGACQEGFLAVGGGQEPNGSQAVMRENL